MQKVDFLGSSGWSSQGSRRRCRSWGKSGVQYTDRVVEGLEWPRKAAMSTMRHPARRSAGGRAERNARFVPSKGHSVPGGVDVSMGPDDVRLLTQGMEPILQVGGGNRLIRTVTGQKEVLGTRCHWVDRLVLCKGCTDAGSQCDGKRTTPLLLCQRAGLGMFFFIPFVSTPSTHQASVERTRGMWLSPPTLRPVVKI